MTESQSRGFDEPVLVSRSPRHKLGWSATATVAGLAVIAAAGSWWNSHRPENSYLRGRQALRSGDRQTVLRESRRLIATPGFEPQGHLLSGLLFVSAGKLVEALPDLQLAAQSETTAVEAMTAAAKCYYLTDRYIEVIDAARAALARDHEALDARRWLAAAYYDLGATTAAAAEMATIAAKAPDDPRPERLLGLIDKDNEQFAEAVVHYRESLRRNPDQSDRQTILVELAEALVKLSHFDEALQTLQDCDRTAPTLTLSAECAESQGRTDEAQELLREAMQLDPQFLPASLKRGTLLLLLARAGEAASVLEGAVRLAPHNSRAHYYLSQAYGLQGERAKSAEQLRLFQETQQVERRFTDLHELAAQKPHDPEVRYQLGVLARKLDKPELARLWFRAALAIEPNHAATRAALTAADDSSDGR